MGDNFDSEPMAAGGPGLPPAFAWRGQTLAIAGVRRVWRDTGFCRHGSKERYVRKHWFEVVATDKRTARIYFDRQPHGPKPVSRWWLFSIDDGAD